MPLPAVIHCTLPGPSTPVIAEAVAMRDRAGEHIGDRLDAAMGMPGETGHVVAGMVAAKIVHHQERVEFAGVAEAEGAPQPHAGPLHRGAGLGNALDGADRHGGLGLKDNGPYVGADARFVQRANLRRCKPRAAGALA